MNSVSHRPIRVAALLLVAPLFAALGVLANLLLPTVNWEAVPFHSTLEVLGAMSALMMAVFLLMMRRGRDELARYVWVAAGLIGMGLLDGFHAAVLPGYGFVWLHSTATLAGGVVFALAWLPDRCARSRWAVALPWGVALAAAMFGALSLAFRPLLPVMIIAGEFSAAAKIINLLGGLFFLAAFARFSLRYQANKTGDDLLFAGLCLIFGTAGLLFSVSAIWHPDWWLWHLMRLIAYFIALGYVFMVFRRVEGELVAVKNELAVKVVELSHANQALQAENTERQRAEQEIRRFNAELEEQVQQRTAALETANKDLESFGYSVSHDLRTPLRAIDGFSLMLLEDYSARLDDEGRRLLNVVRDNAVKMARLIDDILLFSRAGRLALAPVEVDMEVLAWSVWDELAPTLGTRDVKFEVSALPRACGDHSALTQVLTNLLGNAAKFTRPRDPAVIEVGGSAGISENVYYVKDNGVGFDMQYAPKLFGVFQRLHGVDEFEGTGIGLAIVKRVITMHGGRVWAEGRVNEGATFFFALPRRSPCQGGKS